MHDCVRISKSFVRRKYEKLTLLSELRPNAGGIDGPSLVHNSTDLFSYSKTGSEPSHSRSWNLVSGRVYSVKHMFH